MPPSTSRTLCAAAVAAVLALAAAAPTGFETYATPTSAAAGSISLSGQECTCDVTSATCDGGCCCDADCSTTERALFNCSSTASSDLNYCVAKSSLAAVNLPAGSGLSSVAGSDSDHGFLTSLLCIQADQSPSLGYYCSSSPSSAGSSAAEGVLNASLAAAGTSFHRTASTSAVTGTTYKVGDAIKAGTKSASSTVPVPGGYWALPGPLFSAQCSQLVDVTFMTRLPASTQEQWSSCQVLSSDLSTDCTGLAGLAASAYVDALTVAPSPGSSATLPVTLTKVQVLDLTTGVVGPAVTPLATPSAPAYAAASKVCSSVVQRVSYTVLHDAGAITGVQAALVVADVPAAAAAASTTISQRFSVTWVRNDATVTSKARPVSGTPGYQPGLPLLAAYQSDPADTATLARLVGGLPLPAAASGGSCSAGLYTPVAFGADVQSTCTNLMTYAQLQTFCNQKSSVYALSLLNGLFDTNSGKLRVGIWANADVLNASHWLEARLPTADGTMAVDPSDPFTCKNVPAGLDIRVLTGLAGSAASPIRYVLYVQVALVYADWTFRDQSSQTVAQGFPLQYSVRFLQEPCRPAAAWRGAPPLYLSLPTDIFYPFLTSSAPPPPSLLPAATLLSGLIGAFALLLLV